MNSHDPKIVLIGGGTGSFALLQSLKKMTPNITALVNMADDGGSTGILRDELGVLPPGDVRQCLVALSEAPQELRDLFNFRFPKGSLAGHSFGNLFLSAVQTMTDNFADSVRIASEVLRITGRVVPVTLDDFQLVMRYADQTYYGESEVDVADLHGQRAIEDSHLPARPILTLEPKPAINPIAREAILEADMIVIAAGDIYTSLAPVLLVEGVAEALRETKATIVYTCNLVNKAKQTAEFKVTDYAAEIERFVGSPVLNYVLYNTDVPDDELLHKYALEGEYPVLFDQETLNNAHYEAIPGKFLSRADRQRDQSDIRITRSLIRHDGDAVTKVLKKHL